MVFRSTKAILAALLLWVTSGVASAALITGNMSVTGAFTANNTLDTATSVDLSTVLASFGSTGDVDTFLDPGDAASSIGGPIDLVGLVPVVNLFTIGGFQLDWTSFSSTDQTASVLNLQGAGTLSGNGFDPTGVNWSFSANGLGSSWSMTVSPIPVPAAAWLFGSGLLALAGLARRRTA